MSTSPWPWQPSRFREIMFTDLFMGETDLDIRGLRDDTEDAPVVRRVPVNAFTDEGELRAMVMARRNEAEFLLDYDNMRFRCSRIDNISGIWFNLRRCMSPVPQFADLDLGNITFLNHLRSLGASECSGLLLVSGAMGHGKTTTACSLLQEWLTLYGNVAVTIEDPVEMVMEGRYGEAGRCFQTQAPEGRFGEAMRLTARRSPRYILLGEIRSPEEASQAIRAAVNGQLVLSTIHSGDVIGTIQSILKLVSGTEDVGMAREILADGLLGIVHQQLRRTRTEAGWSLRPHVSSLFFPRGPGGSRHMIRTDKLLQLSTPVAAQAIRMKKGLPPVDPAED